MTHDDIGALLQDITPVERASLAESLFSLDCLKNLPVRESVLDLEEKEAVNAVEGYSDYEVFAKYIEVREQMDDPLNLAECMAEKMEWEYESQGGMYCFSERLTDPERDLTDHAMELLENYEKRYGKWKKTC